MKKLFNIMTLFCLMVSIWISQGDGKVYTRCQLVKELNKFNFPRSFISNWVCLVENESGRSTTKVTQFPNLTTSYGIFQINSKTWCRKGRKGGDCAMRCEDFLNDDISDDIRCVKQIYDRLGFLGWNGWKNKCRGKPLPDVSHC